MMKGFPPRCYIIGAQKAGTTYLASLLDQHPEILVSRPKETDYFTGRVFPRGEEWYRKCFQEDVDKVLVDASTSYSAAFPLHDPRSKDVNSSFNGVAQRIQETVPDARFFYLLRNPIHRVYSAYWHAVRTGTETRSFHKAMTEHSGLTEHYLLLSDYETQIRHYLKYFEMSRIHVMFFEEFVKDPNAILHSCFQFLGLSTEADIELEVGKHKSYQYNGILNKINQLMAPWGGLRPVLGAVKRVVPDALVKQAAGSVTKSIPPMDRDDFVFLVDYFSPRIERLEGIIGRSLDHLWLSADVKR